MSKEVVESDGVMKQCDTLAINESVCSSGVEIVDVVKQEFHGNDSEGKEKEAISIERSSNLDMGERRSILTVEMVPRVSDHEEDIMFGLKEFNEAIELKRRAAKKKEKARKNISKKLNIKVFIMFSALQGDGFNGAKL
ncbi:hypothetical protein PIB30_082300 [Stylosanthes scabra]|uniref:Uncharacterized protein n=1 Tax=Stylosanthes scabra TaxID=79078 RepID=A0ABU6VQR7_9FABA|nr:hypothetical protein [Stylosanthes scabra]